MDGGATASVSTVPFLDQHKKTMEDSLRALRNFVNTPTSIRETGRCRPWDKADFAKRVSTFKLENWFAKPACISPLECARYGWQNSGKDTLHCHVCGSNAFFGSQESSVLSPSALQKTKELHEKWKSQLTECHSPLCSWKINPSPLSFSKPECTKPDFLKRSETFQNLHGSIPGLSPKFFETLSQESITKLEALTTVIGNEFPTNESQGNSKKVESILSLFGWICKPNELHCDLCQRSINLNGMPRLIGVSSSGEKPVSDAPGHIHTGASSGATQDPTTQHLQQDESTNNTTTSAALQQEPPVAPQSTPPEASPTSISREPIPNPPEPVDAIPSQDMQLGEKPGSIQTEAVNLVNSSNALTNQVEGHIEDKNEMKEQEPNSNKEQATNSNTNEPLNEATASDISHHPLTPEPTSSHTPSSDLIEGTTIQEAPLEPPTSEPAASSDLQDRTEHLPDADQQPPKDEFSNDSTNQSKDEETVQVAELPRSIPSDESNGSSSDDVLPRKRLASPAHDEEEVQQSSCRKRSRQSGPEPRSRDAATDVICLNSDDSSPETTGSMKNACDASPPPQEHDGSWEAEDSRKTSSDTSDNEHSNKDEEAVTSSAAGKIHLPAFSRRKRSFGSGDEDMGSKRKVLKEMPVESHPLAHEIEGSDEEENSSKDDGEQSDKGSEEGSNAESNHSEANETGECNVEGSPRSESGEEIDKEEKLSEESNDAGEVNGSKSDDSGNNGDQSDGKDNTFSVDSDDNLEGPGAESTEIASKDDHSMTADTSPNKRGKGKRSPTKTAQKQPAEEAPVESEVPKIQSTATTSTTTTTSTSTQQIERPQRQQPQWALSLCVPEGGFDPAKSHRSFCPWSIITAKGTQPIPAWQSQMDSLQPTESKSPPPAFDPGQATSSSLSLFKLLSKAPALI
ncbi:C3HC zinc finger-like [Pelomyxa schiedti]|nr:C3HC zinc finger-like [Pelomyxa schiedti]